MNITARVKRYVQKKFERKVSSSARLRSPKLGSIVAFDSNGTMVQGRVIKTPPKMSLDYESVEYWKKNAGKNPNRTSRPKPDTKPTSPAYFEGGSLKGGTPKPKTFKDKRTRLLPSLTPKLKPNDPHTYSVQILNGPMRGRYTTVNSIHSKKFKVVKWGEET